jgi:serine/threonine-protein kinase
MAPEHASGKPIDHRADLFALGVTCFEMLTGAPPFEGDGVDVAYANMTKDMPAMRDVAPGVEVDPLLEAFTRKLMARSLDARLASARAARELLDLIEDDRDAARAALGLGPAPVAPPVSRPVMAMPALSPRARPVSISSGSVTHPDALCDTLQMRAITGRSRTRVAVAAAVAAGLLAIALLALRDDPAPAPKIAAARIEAPSPPTTPVVRELPPATVIMTVPAPPPSPPVARVLPPTTAIVAVRPTPPTVRTPPSVRPRTVAPPTVATHAPTVPQRVPPPPAAGPYVTPSAAELARYYAVIGRKLAQLDHAHGQPATLELWPRYRRLRIQSLLANPDDRRAGAAELRTIERLIDAAMRSSP